MHAQLLDVFRCVERLSETSPAALRKLVQRDSLIAAVPRTDAEPAFKVDTRELLRRLPLHVMACVLAQEPREEGKSMPPLPVVKRETHIHIISQECIERSNGAGDWVASMLSQPGTEHRRLARACDQGAAAAVPAVRSGTLAACPRQCADSESLLSLASSTHWGSAVGLQS